MAKKNKNVGGKFGERRSENGERRGENGERKAETKSGKRQRFCWYAGTLASEKQSSFSYKDSDFCAFTLSAGQKTKFSLPQAAEILWILCFFRLAGTWTARPQIQMSENPNISLRKILLTASGRDLVDLVDFSPGWNVDGASANPNV